MRKISKHKGKKTKLCTLNNKKICCLNGMFRSANLQKIMCFTKLISNSVACCARFIEFIIIRKIRLRLMTN